MEDAVASCSGYGLDGKARYCAGRAAYELGLFEESRDHFEKALKDNPRDSKYRKDINRAVCSKHTSSEQCGNWITRFHLSRKIMELHFVVHGILHIIAGILLVHLR
jgi:tetratricopeptide (TPR) repeat protein